MATPPTGEVKRAASLLSPARALDIACGTGRHAIWLYEHGWQVTAVDRDEEAIARIRGHYPGIDARVIDLERSPLPMPEAAYDLIVCWLYFQRDLYPAIRAGLRPGGIAALSALLQGRFAANPGELRTYFPGWTLLHEAETERTCELIVQRSATVESGKEVQNMARKQVSLNIKNPAVYQAAARLSKLQGPPLRSPF
jgi:SAM-dependent methyltransferase